MTGTDLLHSIAATLEATGIPFMLTGSMASAYDGAGRATMDIDLIIDPTRKELDGLVKSVLTAGLYVSASAAHEAFEHRSMFNEIDRSSGWKVGLILKKPCLFSRVEFARRVPVEYQGRQLPVATVEDVIIAKLEWAKLGGSARQIEDVAALLRVQGDALDRSYLDRWVADLGLGVQFRQAMDLAADRS